jgi:AraC-like DNA-binding protein
MLRIVGGVPRGVEETNRWMLRARDAIDRGYARPLDIPALARIAAMSEAHFIRTFRATFGETPHRYLQRRRIERAMALLRDTDASVTGICFQIGFGSLGTFSRTFQALVGESPSLYRHRHRPPVAAVPTCFTMAWLRPNDPRPSSPGANGSSASSPGANGSGANGSGPRSFGEAAGKRPA